MEGGVWELFYKGWPWRVSSGRGWEEVREGLADVWGGGAGSGGGRGQGLQGGKVSGVFLEERLERSRVSERGEEKTG